MSGNFSLIFPDKSYNYLIVQLDLQIKLKEFDTDFLGLVLWCLSREAPGFAGSANILRQEHMWTQEHQLSGIPQFVNTFFSWLLDSWVSEQSRLSTGKQVVCF